VGQSEPRGPHLFGAGYAPFCKAGNKPRHIGFLGVRSRSTPSNPDVYYDAFVQAMHELGYVEGRDLVIEWRFADSNYQRLPMLAIELVQMNVEVIATHSTTATKAAQRATSTIPIVTASTGDPLYEGFAASLAHPGGNITGFSMMNFDLTPKHIELLKAMVPQLSRVAALVNPGNSSHPDILKSLLAVAQQAHIHILPVNAATPEQIEHGFATMIRERADGMVMLGDAFFLGQGRQIAALASKNRIPSISRFPETVRDGFLIGYGQSILENYRHAAIYVDKVLKGALPGELPFEQPSIIHLAVNRGTAAKL
jgi:putative ABC transport system substrate-binding protein